MKVYILLVLQRFSVRYLKAEDRSQAPAGMRGKIHLADKKPLPSLSMKLF